MTGEALNALRLPAVLRELAEAAGLDAALALADAKGGTRVYIPYKLDDGHWLPTLVGLDAANALRQRYAGETINIPLGQTGVIQDARGIARQTLKDGAGVAQAARASGLTERSVYRLLEREGRPRDTRQLSLFNEND